MLIQSKSINICKEAGGLEITSDMLIKINSYAQKEMKAEDVYVRKLLIAHSGIDRDLERFPEPVLDGFAETLPGKSFLEAHNTGSPPIGLFFDASTEEMTPDSFKTLTGEDIRLPDGVKTVKVVFGWVYVIRAEFNEKLIENLASGIYRHISIGFSASGKVPVIDEERKELFQEYVAPAMSREVSIVYLGSQPGCVSVKGAKVLKSAATETKAELKENRMLSFGPKKETVKVCPYDQKKKEANKSVSRWSFGRKKKTGCSMGVNPDAKKYGTWSSPKEVPAPEADGEARQTESKETGRLYFGKKPSEEKTAVSKKPGTSEDKESSTTIDKEAREKMELAWLSMKTFLGDIAMNVNAQRVGKKAVQSMPVKYFLEDLKHLQQRWDIHTGDLQPESRTENKKGLSFGLEKDENRENGGYPSGTRYEQGRLVIPLGVDCGGGVVVKQCF